MNINSYFSISFDLIVKDAEIPYDLFVNSSGLEGKQKFIRIFHMGNDLTATEIDSFKKKYTQLYVSESQRSLYMQSLVKSDAINDVETASFIKDSAISYLHNVFDPEKEFSTELLYETISGCKDAVERMIDVLDDYNIDGLRSLIGSLSGHDFYTYDHSINVSMYCITILRTLKPAASRTELMHAGLGGLLHDLGKIKIPTEILNCPRGLTDEEYAVIKTHADLGLKLLLDAGETEIEGVDLESIGRVIHEHHENWNGTGYPQKLAEKEIHVLARICAIADFFDAVTTKRSYSEVVPISQAISIMEKTAGKKIDPKIFKAFINHIEYSKVSTTKDLQMADHFDPAIPYEKLPLEIIEEMENSDDFGKIRLIDEEDKKKKKKKK